MTSTDIEKHEGAGSELANRRLDAGLAEGNGVINPARWQMLAAIAETVAGTTFVPKGLRGDSKATLACLLYGDALGMQPMSSLKEIHVIDGVPGLSAAAMQALVRKAHPGHRIKREELREDGRFFGVKVTGIRGDTEETDEYTYTLEMAARAGLTGKDNWKKYPEAMCSARAISQIATFLFPDVFMGSPYVPEEVESFRDASIVVDGASHAEEGHVVVKPPPAEPVLPNGERGRDELQKLEDAARERETATEQTEWEVADADTQENITYINTEGRDAIRAAGPDDKVRFEGVDYEVVGFEVDGATGVEKLFVRKHVTPGKPEPGTPAAVVDETIPKVFEYVIKAQETGNTEFIRGVLDAERAGKNRSRLTGAIEEILEKMGAVLDEAGVEGGSEAAEEGEFVPLGDEQGAAAPAAEEVDVELDPEIPFGSATKRAKVARVRALCAYMEDQHPAVKAWTLAGVVASADRQWGGIETIDDLTEEQLELIWQAAEKHGAGEAIEFLALASPDTIAKMSAPPESE